MNFDEESTKIKLWLSIGFMKKDKDKDKGIGAMQRVFKKDFTLAGMQQKVFEGMISMEIEQELDRKTIQIYNTINKVERAIHEEDFAIEEEFEDDDEQSDKKESLLKEYR